MKLDVDQILAAGDGAPPGEAIGSSREGRPILAHRYGTGALRVSLLAGCHADEPVGPLLLHALASCLHQLPSNHRAITDFDWWIVPHANPDGAHRNRAWSEGVDDHVDPVAYLEHVVRESPGDDVEFGFPRDVSDLEARPENRAIHEWWREDERPFRFHASLHGMAVAAGPWFLLEAAWKDRSASLQERCRRAVRALGYRLHDVNRGGDKGFVRIGPGFSTRPDSREMQRFFRERGDDATAARFRPSSMETVRALGGDALTVVSEMPLFLLPGENGTIATSDDLAAWKHRLTEWKLALVSGADEALVRREIDESGIVPMPVRDQMHLQWELVRAGIELVNG